MVGRCIICGAPQHAEPHRCCVGMVCRQNSSCEAESTVLWTLQFLKAQGFAVTDKIIYQDNQSTILLEKNGTKSSGKRTHHLDIRYFSSQIGTIKKGCELNNVRRRLCGPIHIPNRYRDVCSGNKETGCLILLCRRVAGVCWSPAGSRTGVNHEPERIRG
jgi:hypothetical protein